MQQNMICSRFKIIVAIMNKKSLEPGSGAAAQYTALGFLREMLPLTRCKSQQDVKVFYSETYRALI